MVSSVPSFRRSARALGLGLLGLQLTACLTVGPDYTRPTLPVPETFRAADQVPAATGAAPGKLDDWWRLFGDAELERLITLALAENADLRIALARVEEARAITGQTRADRLPDLTVSGGAGRSKFSTRGAPLPPGAPTEDDRFDVRVNLVYSVDLWGRLRRTIEAAEAELLATEHGAAAVRWSLSAAVARAYFELRALDYQLAIAGNTRESRRKSLNLQQLRFEAGVISGLELAQAQAELAATEAVVPQLEEAVSRTENQLSILTGRNPQAVPRGRELHDLAVPPAVPPGLPSTLLTRRPDVALAEQQLVAANARIGVAKAAYFPTLNLTAIGGRESSELGELLSSGAGVWNLAAGFVAPLFHARRTSREVAAAEARVTQAAERYRQALQGAFVDVENGLVARRTSAERHIALDAQVAALTTALELAQQRYEAGSSSYLEVLDAQRNLFRAQLDATSSRQAELAAAVALFEALGGGFSAP